MIGVPRFAFSQKRTFGWAAIYVRFLGQSGLFGQAWKRSAYDP